MLQGWHADPFGVHERRYFSAGSPTKLVRDGTAEYYDEPPQQEWTAAEIPAAGSIQAPAPVNPLAESTVRAAQACRARRAFQLDR